jgi:DNA excision repair protein ERCC-2
MFRTHLTSRGVSGVLTQASQFGEMVRDHRKLEGRLPRSYVHGASGFLTFWQTLEESEYVKLITKYDSKAFEAYCLDSSIACKPIAECHSSIHMSGTLKPLDEYRDSIGLPKDARLAEVPSPFPPENRLVLYMDDVTTKYEDIERDEKMADRIAEHISSIISGAQRSAIVFYPSYATMERLAPRTRMASGGKRVLFERRDMEQGDFMKVVGEFKTAPGTALMHAIAGGRVSEGIDFPGEEMEVAVIAGIPYPKPTAKQRAFQHFCELKFGDGWERSVKAPTMRKLQQAIGRLIRSETDRGVAVILDKRAVHFADSISARKTTAPAEDIEAFFDGRIMGPVTETAAVSRRLMRDT